MLGQYVGVVEMECQCLIDMINQHVLPDCKTAGLSTAGIEGALASLEAGLHGVHAACVHAAAPCPSASLYAALRASLNLPCVPLLLARAVTMYCAPQRVRELLCTPSACVWLCRWLALASRVVCAHSEDEEEKQAALCRVLRLETMVAAREAVEEQEAVRRPHLTCALGCFCAALTGLVCAAVPAVDLDPGFLQGPALPRHPAWQLLSGREA